MKPSTTITLALAVFITILIISPVSVFALDAVASFKRVTGTTYVERGSTTISARKGLILFDQDTIVTRQASKATIVFRDGSTIRLFPNTRFLIEKSVESKSGSRTFINNFILKVGSFWGKFTQRSTHTLIKTPTATAGIKGTTVSFLVKDGHFNMALSSGKVDVQNESEEVRLSSGQMVQNISKTNLISENIQALPYRLALKADTNQVVLPEPGQILDLYFTLQLISFQTKKNVFRAGSVYISHELDNLKFDDDIQLNQRGYARFKATVGHTTTNELIGRMEIHAIMDGEEFIDVAGGSTVLTFTQKGSDHRKVRIDAGSGGIE